MIRVVLPHHLRTLARTGNEELRLELEGQVTIGQVIEGIETSYPMLRGTIRDHGTQKRRALVRFFACGEDISHESFDTPLPPPIVKGDEPFFVIGAIAGG